MRWTELTETPGAHGLQPHRVRQFKLSTGPKFVDKLRDVIGLYVDPPAHAIVLSVDGGSARGDGRRYPGARDARYHLRPLRARGVARGQAQDNREPGLSRDGL